MKQEIKIKVKKISETDYGTGRIKAVGGYQLIGSINIKPYGTLSLHYNTYTKSVDIRTAERTRIIILPDGIEESIIHKCEDTIKEFRESKNMKHNSTNPIMKYFEYKHLPEHLQAISKPICEAAIQMDIDLPDGPEKSSGLRKLLEAKDCFVRAGI